MSKRMSIEFQELKIKKNFSLKRSGIRFWCSKLIICELRCENKLPVFAINRLPAQNRDSDPRP